MSIEASSKKEALITGLKKIRDGLRSLTQFDEIAKQYEERLVAFDVEKDEALIQNKSNRLKKESEIKAVCEKLDERRGKLASNKRTTDSCISSNKKLAAKRVFLILFILLEFVFAFVLFGIMARIQSGSPFSGGMAFIFGLGRLLIVFIGVIAAIASLVSFVTSKRSIDENKRLIDAAARSTAYEEKAIEEDTAKLEELRKSLEALESLEDVANRCDAAKAEYENEMLPKLKKNLADKEVILSELENASGLDRRDWVHIELIVYLLETNRADDLKEALQLVDREMQTRQIIAKVESSNDRVVKVFGEGIAVVGKQIQLSTEIQAELLEKQSKVLVQMASDAQIARQHLADANAKLADMRNQQVEQIAILGKIAADTQRTAYNTGLTAANTAEIAFNSRTGGGVTYVPDSKYYPYV